MSDINPNEQAATTTSVSNKEYSTYLPLSIAGEKTRDDGPGVFANPFSDEVEAASLRGFFLQTDNKATSSYAANNEYSGNSNASGSDRNVQLQPQLYTTQQDPGPALPLHFQNPEPIPGLTQLNASSFVLGEIPAVSATASVVSDNRHASSSSHGGNRTQMNGQFQAQESQSVSSSHQDGKQLGIFHTQHPASVSSFHSQYAGGNVPSTISASSMSTHQTNPSYISMKTSVPVKELALHTNSKRTKRKSMSNTKVGHSPVHGVEDTRKRRKHERNLREQQRSHRITEQISELRKVLVDTANVAFKKTDKYSILCKAVDHIRDLQNQCVALDAEHRKLVETISQTSEIVHQNSGLVTNHDKISAASHPDTIVSSMQGFNTRSNDEMINQSDDYIPEASTSTFFNSMALFDYKTIFGQCCAALAVFGLDGVLVDCNEAFEVLCGLHDRKEGSEKDMNLFHMVKEPKDVAEICKVMGTMIREKTNEARFWSGEVCSMKDSNQKLVLNLTLTRNQEGAPRFFNCALFNAT